MFALPIRESSAVLSRQGVEPTLLSDSSPMLMTLWAGFLSAKVGSSTLQTFGASSPVPLPP